MEDILEKLKIKNLSIFAYLSTLLVGAVVFALLGSSILSYIIAKNVFLEEIKSKQQTVLKLFVQNIEKDFKFGLYPEVYQKCKAASQEKGIIGIRVFDKEGSSICDFNTSKNEVLKQVFQQSIFFDSTPNHYAGKVEIVFSSVAMNNSLTKALTLLALGAVLVFVILFFPLIKMSKLFSRPILEISEMLKTGNLSEIKSELDGKDQSIKELNDLYRSITEMAAKALSYENEKIERSKSESLYNHASSIIHDLRNPILRLKLKLSKLNLNFEDKAQIDDDFRLLENLTQNVLKKYRAKHADTSGNDIPIEVTSIIKNVASSFKFQVSKDSNISFVLNHDSSVAYTNSDALTLTRIFSNLIKNAVEASSPNGAIVVSSYICDEKIVIKFNDNGIGIPEDRLAQIFQEGFSYRKPSGTGIGLSYCKDELINLGGDISIKSKLGEGTEVIVHLPLESVPIWATSELLIPSNTRLVIVDDDSSIHEFWDQKALELDFNFHNVQMLHFSTVDSLSIYLEENNSLGHFFVFDYELSDKQTGIELILENDLKDKSILISNHFDDQKLLKKCTENAIKLFPKQNLTDLNISLLRKSGQPNQELIILDDDEEILNAVASFLESSKFTFQVFSSYDVLSKNLNKISSNAIFLIDKNLSTVEDGMHVSRDLHFRGFRNIHLFTGDDAEKFENCYWLSGVVCKTEFNSFVSTLQ